jgi:hypothetical protein
MASRTGATQRRGAAGFGPLGLGLRIQCARARRGGRTHTNAAMQWACVGSSALLAPSMHLGFLPPVSALALVPHYSIIQGDPAARMDACHPCAGAWGGGEHAGAHTRLLPHERAKRAPETSPTRPPRAAAPSVGTYIFATLCALSVAWTARMAASLQALIRAQSSKDEVRRG